MLTVRVLNFQCALDLDSENKLCFGRQQLEVLIPGEVTIWIFLNSEITDYLPHGIQ